MRALSWNDIAPRVPEPAPSAEGRSRLRVVRDAVHRQPAWLLTAVTLLVAVAAALFAFSQFAHATFDVGPGEVRVAAAPAFPGTTTLSLPPFGSVTAATHVSPLAVTASLEEVDPSGLQRLALKGMPNDRTLEGFKSQVTHGAARAFAKGLLAAGFAAAIVGWALRRTWKAALVAGALGLVVPTLLVASAVAGFDQKAFRQPNYTGAMRYAPSLIALAQTRIDRVDSLQHQLDGWVKQLNAYYSHPQTFASGGALPHTFRVLQVSDLHLDPVGFRLESVLADEFKASVILDCGDADNYGSPLEASVLHRFLDTRIPRIFVPGNHESPNVVKAIGSLKNVTVLESRTVEVDGLRVFGLADPASHVESWVPSNDDALAAGKASAAALSAQIASGAPAPQIVATHNPAGLPPFAGMAPLLVAGHTHTMDMGHFGTSWYVNSGTVGGVDFAKLYTDPSMPHGASILYYTDTLPRKLVAIDQIQIWGRVDQSSLKRTIVDPALLEELKARDAAKPSAGPTAAEQATAGKAAAARR